MSVWAITGIGIGMVFFILIVLSETLRIIGNVLGPKPQPVGAGSATTEDHGTENTEAIWRDAAIISAIMQKMGQQGNVTIKRLDD